MFEIVIFILGIVLGGCGAYLFMSRRSCPVCATSRIGTHVEKQQTEKQARKEKILEIIRERESVTNDVIEKMLNVSDTTATNYLQELEREGFIEQLGERGRFVSYRLKK